MPIQAPRGTVDILPDEAAYFQTMEDTARQVFLRYGYGEIRTPIFEFTELFSRSIGEETDIVSKEMYTFADRRGRSVTLRPEGTAPVVRALIERNLLGQQGAQVKIYYAGPMFRYERPQAGRQRQFTTIGVEFFGCASPWADAEVIAMLSEYLEALGLGKTTTRINSLGSAASQKAYNAQVRRSLAALKDRLCPDCRRRVEINPLRVLDCKVPEDQALFADLPSLVDSMDEPSRAHYDAVRRALDRLGVAYEERPGLVRGFDYYTHTVFETCLAGLGSQDAVLGGGRYDGLVEELGGPPTPALGAGLGLERLVLAMKAMKIAPSGSAPEEKSVCIVALGEECIEAAAGLTQSIRAVGRRALFDYTARSIKSGLRAANRAEVEFSAIIGGTELAESACVLKNLRTGEEKRVPLDQVAGLVK
ncbi:histidine--tRNA ligase [Candidatus Sumerlaeota bacterium]|nr:histidine--tRNA ligase [Candidatus Sumerlaeota bacterium]